MIVLPWPPSSLSGHAKGHWRKTAEITRKHRNLARAATMAAAVRDLPAAGDIRVTIEFIPPNRRSDRANYPNRVKAYLDGVAEALGVNDRRFAPEYVFRDPGHPSSPGAVIITLGAAL